MKIVRARSLQSVSLLRTIKLCDPPVPASRSLNSLNLPPPGSLVLLLNLGQLPHVSMLMMMASFWTPL